MIGATPQKSILADYCPQRGLDAERERQQIERRQRDDAIHCRASTGNRGHLDPADELLREFRAFRRDVPAILAALQEGGRP